MNNDLAVLSEKLWLERLSRSSASRPYLAMYSTWWEGIVTDPKLMMIPIDDHQAHRGDAVFEAFRIIHGKAYLLNEHLDRLQRSARMLELQNPLSRKDLVSVIEQTVKAAAVQDALVRLFLGRGPGSFSANPYDTLGEQLHVVVTPFRPPAKKSLQEGVRVITSKIRVKDPFMARIKSCNYLVNVLMKKEAVDQGVDFSVGKDEDGFLTEGSTENMVVFTKEEVLTHPPLERILSGCTMRRCFDLAEDFEKAEAPLSVKHLLESKEVMMIGTTLDVISVVQFDGRQIGNGRPGPVAAKLRELLLKDQS